MQGLSRYRSAWCLLIFAYVGMIAALAADYFSHTGGRQRISYSLIQIALVGAIAIWIAAGLSILRARRGFDRELPNFSSLLVLFWFLLPAAYIGIMALGLMLDSFD